MEATYHAAMTIMSPRDLEEATRRLPALALKSASTLSSASDVFISHSRLDTALLGHVAHAIRAEGKVPYADVLDPVVRAIKPGDFGAHFAEAIADCGKLIVLMTPNSYSSRWVPWELGLAHGYFSSANAILWPVSGIRDQASWLRQDYFEIYPHVEISQGRFWVMGGDTLSTLGGWLKS